jgi:hypothetical protein
LSNGTLSPGNGFLSTCVSCDSRSSTFSCATSVAPGRPDDAVAPNMPSNASEPLPSVSGTSGFVLTM